MTIDLQVITVFVLFILAIGYLVYLPIRSKRAKKKSCGGKDCGCA